jgi:hypothetical protein
MSKYRDSLVFAGALAGMIGIAGTPALALQAIHVSSGVSALDELNGVAVEAMRKAGGTQEESTEDDQFEIGSFQWGTSSDGSGDSPMEDSPMESMGPVTSPDAAVQLAFTLIE